MRAPGCGRLALPLLLLTVAALAEGDAKRLKEGETPGNFMEDEQWLSSISQYSGKIKHWNRFRDILSSDPPSITQATVTFLILNCVHPEVP
ncbi:testican-2 [Physeter macrocephalus]|uniref:Testican-2 n=1 Tax=Physeter macrocephalus TaxID=9755 RepID=A0A455AKW4_PHYMC|nr:testican-2 [Physeter catodon]|eukprot:XP_028337280.1 testican-2 [Physeter catodon]